MTSSPGAVPPLFAPPSVTAARIGDAVVLRSAEPLGEYPVSVVHSVRERARLSPDQPMIAERVGVEWRRISYATAVAAADAIGQGLLDRGLGPGKPLLAANQQMIRQAWPFLAAERPVIVDWLPWSHTFGGNHNVNMVLTSGGTLYVDTGRPVPAMFAQTVANLADVPPTVYFNVPAGYAQLVPALEGDPDFAGRFFSRLRLMFNAAAALPPALRERLAAVAEKMAGREVPVTGSWGATETAPAVTSAHYPFDDAGCIGVPLPGAEVKLVPAEEGAYEIRVRARTSRPATSPVRT